ALGAVPAGALGWRVLPPPHVAVHRGAAALLLRARGGAEPRRYLQFADPGLLERMDRSLSAADMRRAEAAGRQLTWAQMMALIHTAETLKRG
ncbi:hypothetical protein, partial [Nocardia brasiliensis]|uniref:hypothetical protein n=1 Tax=Nocardia brasiliensis TaxID=37326 RepID=UPI0024585CBD